MEWLNKLFGRKENSVTSAPSQNQICSVCEQEYKIEVDSVAV
ncbi:MAG TPA: hypothetical protein PLP37_03145 [Clostridiales bacterium]|nr:hypothetical protein [Clostridiales bacterium]